jgi:hypothetical protein
MKLIRKQVLDMFKAMESLVFGYLSETAVVTALSNYNALRKEGLSYQQLSAELRKRIYANVDKDKLKDFFDIAIQFEQEKDVDLREGLKQRMMSEYPDLFELYLKHVNINVSILNKEIELDIELMDKDEFIKGIILGNKEVLAEDLNRVLEPLFTKEGESNPDFAELDEYFE